MKSNSEASPSTVFFFYYTSIFTVLQPLGSECHEIKVNELPETEHEAMGQRQRTEDHGKFLCECLFLFVFFAVIHPTFKHAP